VRSEGSIGLVIECKRSSTERDGLMWFCDNCNEPLHDTYFQLTNVEKDFQPRFKEFYSSASKRTCKKCGHKMEADKRFVE
jgi:3-hydroxyanthranilate 3,4-dioxygenase